MKKSKLHPTKHVAVEILHIICVLWMWDQKILPLMKQEAIFVEVLEQVVDVRIQALKLFSDLSKDIIR